MFMVSRSDRRSVKPISCTAHQEALRTNGSLRADFMMAREERLFSHSRPDIRLQPTRLILECPEVALLHRAEGVKS